MSDFVQLAEGGNMLIHDLEQYIIGHWEGPEQYDIILA